MYGFGYGHGMFFGGMFMWMIFLIIACFILVSFFRGRSCCSGTTDKDSETPEQILKKRLAKGEITEEEYNKTLEVLRK